MLACWLAIRGQRQSRPRALGLVASVATMLTLVVAGAATATAATPPAKASFAVSAPASAAAGTAQTVKVTALLNGQANPGYRGAVVLTSTDTQAVLPAQYTFTKTDKGVHSFQVTFKTSGSQKVTATDAASSASTGSQTVTVAPGPAAKFASITLAAVTAGTPQDITLNVLDAFNNIATGYRGTVHLASTDAKVLPANYAFTASDAGTHTFGVTLKTAGTQTVTLSETAPATLAAVSTPAVSVSPASASSLRLAGLGDAVAGTSQSANVTVLDQYGNVAKGYTGTVAFTSTDPAAALPPNYTFTAIDAGSHSFGVTHSVGVTLTTAGQQSVTVTDQLNSLVSSSPPLAISAGPASALHMTTSPTMGQYEGSSTTTAGDIFKVILTAVDQYGNRAPDYTGTVKLTSSDDRTTLPALPGGSSGVKFDSGDAGRIAVSGVAMFDKKTYVQHASLTAVDTSNSQLADGLTFKVLPGPAVTYSCPQPLMKGTDPANLYRLPNGPIGVNDDIGLQFVALDAYGNNATNQHPQFPPPGSGFLPFGYEGTATVTTDDIQAVGITNLTLSASPLILTQPATITLRTAGTQHVMVQDQANPSLNTTCSYKVSAPTAISGTVAVADPHSTGRTQIWLAASTGVGANDPTTISISQIPVVPDPPNAPNPLGLVFAARGGVSGTPYLIWDLNPSPIRPGTLTCDGSVPCAAASGLMQIAYTLTDAFGNPPSNGLLNIEPFKAPPAPGDIRFGLAGQILVPGGDIPIVLGHTYNGTVTGSDPIAGTQVVQLANGTSMNLARPDSSSLSVGDPVSVRAQTGITVESDLPNLCTAHTTGDPPVTTTTCTDSNGCTANTADSAPVQACQTSSFATVTITPGTTDPNNPPLSTNTQTSDLTDVCGALSNTNNAACPYLIFDWATRADGGSGLPPTGIVGAPYWVTLGVSFKFVVFSSRTGGEPITFSLTDDPLSGPSHLPDGITLTPDGTLFGIPTKIGLFRFNVTATGTLTGATATATLVVEVA
jgi:hypothetical protein